MLYHVWFSSPIADDVVPFIENNLDSIALTCVTGRKRERKFRHLTGLFLEGPENFSGPKRQLSN